MSELFLHILTTIAVRKTFRFSADASSLTHAIE